MKKFLTRHNLNVADKDLQEFLSKWDVNSDGNMDIGEFS